MDVADIIDNILKKRMIGRGQTFSRPRRRQPRTQDNLFMTNPLYSASRNPGRTRTRSPVRQDDDVAPNLRRPRRGDEDPSSLLTYDDPSLYLEPQQDLQNLQPEQNDDDPTLLYHLFMDKVNRTFYFISDPALFRRNVIEAINSMYILDPQRVNILFEDTLDIEDDKKFYKAVIENLNDYLNDNLENLVYRYSVLNDLTKEQSDKMFEGMSIIGTDNGLIDLLNLNAIENDEEFSKKLSVLLPKKVEEKKTNEQEQKREQQEQQRELQELQRQTQSNYLDDITFQPYEDDPKQNLYEDLDEDTDKGRAQRRDREEIEQEIREARRGQAGPYSEKQIQREARILQQQLIEQAIREERQSLGDEGMPIQSDVFYEQDVQDLIGRGLFQSQFKEDDYNPDEFGGLQLSSVRGGSSCCVGVIQKVLKGRGIQTASSKPPEKSFYKAVKNSYARQAPAEIHGGYELVLDTKNFDAYLDRDTKSILIGSAGTNFKDPTDVKADVALTFNMLRFSNRYKQDKEQMKKLVEKYPPNEYKYYVAGHSLSGAIITQLRRDFPFIEYGVAYNSAFQPSDLIKQDNNIKRLYTNTDFLYSLGGRLFRDIQLVSATDPNEQGFFKHLIKNMTPSGYKGHALSNFAKLYGEGKGKIPKGFHRMPDGSIMADKDHFSNFAKLYGEGKYMDKVKEGEDLAKKLGGDLIGSRGIIKLANTEGDKYNELINKIRIPDDIDIAIDFTTKQIPKWAINILYKEGYTYDGLDKQEATEELKYKESHKGVKFTKKDGDKEVSVDIVAQRNSEDKTKEQILLDDYLYIDDLDDDITNKKAKKELAKKLLEDGVKFEEDKEEEEDNAVASAVGFSTPPSTPPPSTPPSTPPRTPPPSTPPRGTKRPRGSGKYNKKIEIIKKIMMNNTKQKLLN